MAIRSYRVAYVRYSGRLSEIANYKIGDTELEEVPYRIAKKGVPMEAILPGFRIRKEKEALCNAPNISYHFVPVPYVRGNPFFILLFNILATFHLINIHKRRRIDIIHFFPHTFLTAFLFKALTNAKTVSQFYDINARPSKLWHLIEKFSIAISTIVIANSHEIRKQIFEISKKRTFVIPPGINLSMFQNYSVFDHIPGSISSENQGIPAVYLGTLEKLRNLENIIYLVKKLKDKVGSLLTVTFVGEGDGKLSLVEIVNRFGLNGLIKFSPPIPHEIVPKYLKEFEIGISYIPRRYEFSPPLKTLEYLAAGLTVIGTDTYGNRLVIKDMFNGVLVGENVASNDADIAKIEYVLLNPKIRKKIKKHARDTVRGHDWENRILLYLKAYHKVMGGVCYAIDD